jgi:hypothetical protein
MNGGRYWARTSDPCRVKRVYGAHSDRFRDANHQAQPGDHAITAASSYVTVRQISDHPESS